MKKGVFCIAILLLIFIPFTIAQNETIDEKGYNCLQNKVDNVECNGLSFEEMVFSLLTLGQCGSEVQDHPDYQNDLKLTAQAILALDKVGVDTTDAKSWLFSQTKTPSDFVWYLQIDSAKPTTCNVNYGTTNHAVTLLENKKLSSATDSCLSLASGDYWLNINPNCYENEFEISCDEDFLTTLLFRTSAADSTIHVSAESHSGLGGGGSTQEKINILCFGKNNCDYESSLWATSTLNVLGYNLEINPFKSYLGTMAEKNSIFFPESFLYTLTGETSYLDEIIKKQNSEGSWGLSPKKYYDTALALIALPSGGNQRENAINWLKDNQAETGCWNSNHFRDTALILFSSWPGGVRAGVEGRDVLTDGCQNSGYFCMSGINCEGQILNEYSCSGFDKCCSQEQFLESCSDFNGEICNSNQQCVGGKSESTFDLEYGQTCCVDGACEVAEVETFTCESSGGTCKISACAGDEEESFETCEFGDTCCVEKTVTAKGDYSLVGILFILILITLVVIGIIKKDKLREYWFRAKSKFIKPKFPPAPTRGMPRRGMPPITPAATQRRLMQSKPVSIRKRLPVKRPSQVGRIKTPSVKSGELNDVLKKLKEMGK